MGRRHRGLALTPEWQNLAIPAKARVPAAEGKRGRWGERCSLLNAPHTVKRVFDESSYI